MSASKLIHYFPSHLAAYGFWASSPPDNIILNLAKKKTDQSLSDFQTDIGSSAHITVGTEWLISHTRTALTDTVASLQGSDGGVIAASEVHELIIFMTLWMVLCLIWFVIQLVF